MTEALPFEPPPALTPARVLSVAIVVAGAASVSLAALALTTLFGPLNDLNGPLTVSTTLLCALLARGLSRAGSSAAVVWWCSLGASLLGALNAGLCVAVAGLAHGELRAAFVGLLLGSALGIVFGSPLGLVYGLVILPPSLAVQRQRERGSHDASARALLWAGGWLAVVGLLSFPVALRHPCSAALSLGAIALGGGGAGLGLWWTRRRAGWLEDVVAGRVAGWRVRPAAPAESDGLRPFVDAPPAPTTHVLVSTLAEGYRQSARELPLATVPARAVLAAGS